MGVMVLPGLMQEAIGYNLRVGPLHSIHVLAFQGMVSWELALWEFAELELAFWYQTRDPSNRLACMVA